MEKRWILQFCHCHYGPFLDVARQYAALFKDRPYKVLTVYLTGEDTPEARAGSASDDVIFLGFKSRQVSGLKWQAIQALRKILQSRDFSLIIAHRFKPIYIACLAGKLPVIGVHHAFGDYDRAPRRWFAHAFRQRLMLLGVSDAVRDDLRRCLPNWPAERIATLYNRIDIAAVQGEQISREAARATLGLALDAFVVGNVGRLHPDKDQATLIRGFAQALPRLPANARLVIVGEGELESELKALAHQLGITEHVDFLGQVAHARRYFRAFDIFALSSDHEPFGMVLLEAMAANVPLVSTNCGGAREIVEGLGQLFTLGNAEQLAEALTTTANTRQTKLHDAGERLQTLFSDQAAASSFWLRLAAARLPNLAQAV
ncbi:glycosyltransferase [Azonexus sp.]|uniref:glycosyltransferase n=1 Tax=Azonexus sp. TaxID=1872668 RepID=UPI0027BB037A|nr:glycosyltransferase [Azonexus sp.]